jgi:hypothetical protein
VKTFTTSLMNHYSRPNGVVVYFDDMSANTASLIVICYYRY